MVCRVTTGQAVSWRAAPLRGRVSVSVLVGLFLAGIADAAALPTGTFTVALTGYLTAPGCKGSSLALNSKLGSTGRQSWTVSPVQKNAKSVVGVPVLLQVGGRDGCGGYATYPKSCKGAITLTRLVPGSRQQQWVLEGGPGGSHSLRPAACPRMQLSFQAACNKPGALLQPKGGAGTLSKLTLRRLRSPAPPPVKRPASPTPMPTNSPTVGPPEGGNPSTTPPLTGGVTVTYKTDNDWGNGYQGTITIQNNNPYTIYSWDLTMTFSDKFNWGPDADVARNGNTVTLTPKSWSTEIAPGAALALTFGSNTAKPSNFQFTQILPPVDPNHDPSLASRGAFGAKVLSPYVDTGLFPPAQLATEAYTTTGQAFYTLAFITAQMVSSQAQPAWGGVIPLSSWHFYDQVHGLRLNGGDVIVSFGGASGIELAQAITDIPSLVAAYQSVIDMYKLKWVDFDIEGGAVADPVSVDRRNKALAQLKANNPGLVFSYTLPVLPAGLTQDGVNLLKSAKANGFAVDVINVMAMDYGDTAAPNADGQMGSYAIQAAQNTYSQAQAAGLTNSKIGVTPMIGVNDVESEVFRLKDAAQLAQWAKQTSWVRLVAFWSISRDRYDNSSYVSPVASSIPQAPYDFTKTFKSNLQ